MHWRNVIAVLGAMLGLVLTTAVAGCGSSGDAAAVTGTISKAQFLKAAIPVCKLGVNEITNYYGQWEKAHTVNGKRPPEAARDRALDRIALEAHKKQLERLKEISLPREGEEFVPRLYEAWEEGIENGENDPKSMQESVGFAFGRAYSMSIGHGLSACWLG
jgi:hypothetical protein